MIFSPFGIGRPSFGNPYLRSLIFVISTLLLECSGFSSCFSSSTILFLDFVSWDWLLLTEAGSIHQSSAAKAWWIYDVQRSDVKVVCFLPWFLNSFYHSLPYWNFEDEIFIRWVECNIPKLRYYIFILFVKYLLCLYHYFSSLIFCIPFLFLDPITYTIKPKPNSL